MTPGTAPARAASATRRAFCRGLSLAGVLGSIAFGLLFGGLARCRFVDRSHFAFRPASASATSATTPGTPLGSLASLSSLSSLSSLLAVASFSRFRRRLFRGSGGPSGPSPSFRSGILGTSLSHEVGGSEGRPRGLRRQLRISATQFPPLPFHHLVGTVKVRGRNDLDFDVEFLLQAGEVLATAVLEPVRQFRMQGDSHSLQVAGCGSSFDSP